MSERWPDIEQDEELEVEEEPESEPEVEPVQHAYGELDVPDDINVIEGSPDGTRRGVAIVASKFNGSSGDGWKMRCHIRRALPAFLSQATATIAVESCLVLASTPT